MFTGLIQKMGRVVDARRGKGMIRLRVQPDAGVDGGESGGGAGAYFPAAGASIAVNGVCLTVVTDARQTGGVLEFDVIGETLAKTTLGSLKKKAPVNLEAAATLQTALGGHLVQGHVDGIGKIVSISKGADYRLRIMPGEPKKGTPEAAMGGMMASIVPKGSVTIDGVSLTVAGVWKEKNKSGFEVALIPMTLEQTTLGGLKRGDEVNIEVDALAKMVGHWVQRIFAMGAKRG